MPVESVLNERSGGRCELCSSASELSVHNLKPAKGSAGDSSVYLCAVCQGEVLDPGTVDSNHWRALSESMWSEHAPVQVAAYRVLKFLSRSGQAWADDLLGQLYLDDELQQWADADVIGSGLGDDDEGPKTVDSNGTQLNDGDTVTLIKDLEVKGANFTAKRGTTVKNIVLTGDPKFVEGKVNGTVIVLVAAYLKKA